MLEIVVNLVLLFIGLSLIAKAYRAISSKLYLNKHTLQALADDVRALQSALEKRNSKKFSQLADSSNSESLSQIWLTPWARDHGVAQLVDDYASQRLEDANAQYFLGKFLVEKAWASRGYAQANTVSKTGWSGFHEGLILAQKALHQSIKLNPNLSFAYKELLRTYRGLGERGEADTLFAIAHEKFPTNYAIHYEMLLLISHKWLGLHGEMMAFAKQYDAENEDGLLAWLIPAALYEAYRDSSRSEPEEEFFTTEQRKKDLLHAVERYISAKYSVVDELSYVDGMQYFALVFFLSKNRSDTNRVFRQFNGFSREAWRNEDLEPNRPFARARRWAGA